MKNLPKSIIPSECTGVNGGGRGWGMHPPTFWQGDAMPLIPLAATNLCQSSQCHIQLSVDCHSSCMNGDTSKYNLLFKWTQSFWPNTANRKVVNGSIPQLINTIPLLLL